MSRAKPKQKTARDTFRDAVDSSGQLVYRQGLQAINEGREQISADDPRKILGSVAIDEDCKATHPSANRWDYVIGHESNGRVIAHFVEVHSAESSEVRKVEQKLDWLLGFLNESPQNELATIDRKLYWVASGRNRIPQHTPQFRALQGRLRPRGLEGPLKVLKLT